MKKWQESPFIKMAKVSFRRLRHYYEYEVQDSEEVGINEKDPTGDPIITRTYSYVTEKVPFGMIAAVVGKDEKYYLGLSLCGPYDTFSTLRAKQISGGRALRQYAEHLGLCGPRILVPIEEEFTRAVCNKRTTTQMEYYALVDSIESREFDQRDLVISFFNSELEVPVFHKKTA